MLPYPNSYEKGDENGVYHVAVAISMIRIRWKHTHTRLIKEKYANSYSYSAFCFKIYISIMQISDVLHVQIPTVSIRVLPFATRRGRIQSDTWPYSKSIFWPLLPPHCMNCENIVFFNSFFLYAKDA